MSEFLSPTDPRLNSFRDNDHGGVHINSSIFNHAYYVIASGVSGNIGIPDAERTFYRCLTTKLLPQSQFIDARLGAIASAEELFGVGSQRALKVAEGFDAIELFAIPVPVPESPTNLPPVSAPESKLWVYTNSSISDYSLARYEAAQGDPVNGVRIATYSKITRPCVNGAGSRVAFVTTSNSLAIVDITNGPVTNLATGQVQSMAYSPLGNYAAFVLRSNDLPTSQLVLLDFVNSLSATVNLKTPVFDDDPMSSISYAGSMSFSPDGKLLVFGALSESTDPDGTAFAAWSIYTLELSTLEIHTLIPPISGLDMGNPVFSRTSSRFIVFDAVFLQTGSDVHVADLGTGSIGLVATAAGRVGRPSFTGDDSAILYADTDNSVSTGVSVYSQPLATDKLAASGSRTRWEANSPVGITYRRGTYTASNAPPSITITAPADRIIFTSPATITITYTATDADGSISRVDLYEGTKLLFTDTNAPFASITGTNFRAGFHRYHLRAYDNRGASALSSPLRIGIRPPQGVGALGGTTTKRFELALATTNDGGFRVEYSTNFVNWTSLGSLESLSNSVYFSDTTVTNHPRRFYRAVKLP